VADYLKIEGSVGLTSVLVGSATVDQAIVPWAGGRIEVLPSGVVLANPAQLLGSDAMANLIDDLISQYDFVVLDSPPLLPVTDSLNLARLTDGAVVVAMYKSTRRQRLAEALTSLEGVSARVLGLVLNGVRPPKHQAYYGYQAPAVGGGGEELGDLVEEVDEPSAGVAEVQPGGTATEIDQPKPGAPQLPHHETRPAGAEFIPEAVDVDAAETDSAGTVDAPGKGATSRESSENIPNLETEPVTPVAGAVRSVRVPERGTRPPKGSHRPTVVRPARGPASN
jgi:hypothetical protein